MLIVPDADSLVVEVKIAPRDVDQVYVGQTATMRFAAFNQKTTPEIDGEVSLVSADITQDRRAGTSYYMWRVPAEAGGTGETRIGQAVARHAGRGLHQDAGSDRAILPAQAAAGSGGARVQGALSASEPDRNLECMHSRLRPIRARRRRGQPLELRLGGRERRQSACRVDDS